jgi:hypothetical protein
MLFYCVRVNTGLGFHWICNRGKKGGYMWIDDDINLQPCFSITPVGRFWLVKTYQYGCHPSVLSHHALGTVECDESNCNERGDNIWLSGVWGILLPWVIVRREGRHDHIWILIFLVTSVPGGGVMPLYDIWAGSTHIGEAATPLVFGVTKTDHSLLLIHILIVF